MGQMIRMTMSDGAEIAVYHAEPEGARRGGLVLIQEIFGVHEYIADVCRRLAKEGADLHRCSEGQGTGLHHGLLLWRLCRLGDGRAE